MFTKRVPWKLFEYTTKKTEYVQFLEIMSILESRISTDESVNQNLTIKPTVENSPYSNTLLAIKIATRVVIR